MVCNKVRRNLVPTSSLFGVEPYKKCTHPVKTTKLNIITRIKWKYIRPKERSPTIEPSETLMEDIRNHILSSNTTLNSIGTDKWSYKSCRTDCGKGEKQMTCHAGSQSAANIKRVKIKSLWVLTCLYMCLSSMSSIDMKKPYKIHYEVMLIRNN